MMAGMGLQMPFGKMMDRRMGLKMPSGSVTEPCRKWAYRCHLGFNRIRDSLARTCVPEKRKIITWPVIGVDLQFLYVDVPWLVTGTESLNSSDVPWQDTGIGSSNSSDVPWQDTGIESGISRQQIHPGKIQESDLQTLQTCPDRIQESSLE